MNDFQKLRNTVDSDEEVYFIWWLEELKKNNVIKNYYRGKSYSLSDDVVVTWNKQLKTKVKKVETVLLSSRVYTPDYKIIIDKYSCLFQDMDNLQSNPNGKNTVIICQDKVALVEIKGSWDNNNMTRLFRLNQKDMYKSYSLYINLLKIPNIFKHTFIPERYLTCNKSNKSRKINFKQTLVNDYLNEKH